jgi:hypothetical protein
VAAGENEPQAAIRNIHFAGVRNRIAVALSGLCFAEKIIFLFPARIIDEFAAGDGHEPGGSECLMQRFLGKIERSGNAAARGWIASRWWCILI